MNYFMGKKPYNKYLKHYVDLTDIIFIIYNHDKMHVNNFSSPTLKLLKSKGHTQFRPWQPRI